MNSSGRGRGVSNLPAWMSGRDTGSRAPGAGAENGPTAPLQQPSPDETKNSYRDRERDRDRSARGAPPDRRRGRSDADFPRSHRRHDDGAGRRPRVRSQQEFFPIFYSWEEEQDWVEERQKKRRARPTLFDKEPDVEQQMQMERMKQLLQVNRASGTTGAAMTPYGLDSAPMPSSSNASLTPSGAVVPQQTRHARRLYVGHLPENVDEAELQHFFKDCIAVATGKKPAGDFRFSSEDEDDPIISVYINRERRFAFVEFSTMEMTTSCMALDGINLNGKGVIKVKRPNDYNPALAPGQATVGLANFDVR